MATVDITLEGVLQLLKDLDEHKTSDTEIQGKILKLAADEVAPAIALMFSKYLSTALSDLQKKNIDLHPVTNDLDEHKTSDTEIQGKILKLAADEVALTLIFNKSLRTGVVPSDWLIANISPIFKKELYTPSNYRPVSLTSMCCKVLEHIMF